MDLFNKQKLKEQEQKFEARLRIKEELIIQYKDMYDNLLQKYEETLQILEISQANEYLLNEQTGRLSKALVSAQSVSFPSKRFNIAKASSLLTKDKDESGRLVLSDKALAKFLHQLITVDIPTYRSSHVKTVEDYLNKAKEVLTKYQIENEKEV